MKSVNFLFEYSGFSWFMCCQASINRAVFLSASSKNVLLDVLCTIPGSTTKTEDHKAAQFLVDRCTESRLPLGKDSAFGNSVTRRFKSTICSVSNGRNV